MDYRKFANKRHCSFDELDGEIIKNVEINDNNNKLILKTYKGIVFTLSGGGNCGKIDAFLENELSEFDNIIGSKIISAVEKGEQYNGGDLLFYYELSTLDNFIQIRFIGEDDTYYASKVDLYRTLTLDEKVKYIEEANKNMSIILDDIQAVKDSCKGGYDE